MLIERIPRVRVDSNVCGPLCKLISPASPRLQTDTAHLGTIHRARLQGIRASHRLDVPLQWADFASTLPWKAPARSYVTPPPYTPHPDFIVV
jgi:hypothetical protein